jgi:hypothetical protein
MINQKHIFRPKTRRKVGVGSGSKSLSYGSGSGSTDKKIVSDPQHWQCCESGSGTGSRSTGIQNFLQDPETDLELKVMDPDLAPDPELDLNLIRNCPNY